MKKLYTIIIMLFVITLQGQNKLLSTINEYYDGSSWQNSWGYNYEYDSNNNLISETYLDWDNGEWKIQEKVIYTYDINNKVIGELGQDWNETTNTLENSYRDTYTYTNGYITGQVAEIWVNSQWANDWKFTFSYDGSLLKNGNGYSWDGTQWVNNERESLTYINNQLIGGLSEKLVGLQWENVSRGTHTYTNNIMTSIIHEEWTSGVWSQSEKYDYTIDANGNRTVEINDYGNSRYKNEYTYDNSSQLSNFAHPFADKKGIDYLFEGNPYVNKILSKTQYYYDFVSSIYRASSRETHNYNSAITLSTKQPEIINTTITVSPNPVNAVLNIDVTNTTIDKVVVFDVTGRTVLQQEANAAQVNVEKLPAGLYILEAYSGNEKFTSKFIKK